MLHFFPRAGLLTCLLVALSTQAPDSYAADGITELKQRTTLRICADPNNLPYSDRAGNGFENKIAELVAAELGVSLFYYWFPQSMGFVRTTLGTRRCDLIIGISSTHELLLNTNPYYASSFALAYPTDSDYSMTSLSDKRFKEEKLRIGLVAGTPPTGLLVENQMMEQVAPYHLMVDTRVDSPSEQIIKDMLAGKLDVAVLWGPLAGHLSKKYEGQFNLTLLTEDHSLNHRLVYNVTMGVRYGEIEWKRWLNRFLRNNEEKILEILAEYNIPTTEIL